MGAPLGSGIGYFDPGGPSCPVCAAKDVEIEQLRAEQLTGLRQFLEEQYPKVDGPGWLQRTNERCTIELFLRLFGAAQAAKESE